MAAAAMAICVRLALFSAVLSLSYCSYSGVPVVVWHSQRLGNDLPSVSALDNLSSKDFEADIGSNLNNSRTVLYFQQDSLSLEDFSKFGNPYGSKNKKNAFKNIQNLLENNPSTMFPSVTSPSKSIPNLANGRKLIKLDGDQIDKFDLDNTFIVFRLPSTEKTSSRQAALLTNDEIIGQIIAKVAALSPSYTAIFTGRRSSWDDGEGQRMRRHTLASSDTNNFTLALVNSSSNASCFMIYADSFTVQYSPTNSFNLTMADLTIDPQSECNSDTNLNVTIQATSVAFRMTFNFNRTDYNDWNLRSATVEIAQSSGDSSTTVDVMMPSEPVYAPPLFSYHCTPMNFTLGNLSNPVAYLIIPNFQIQAFEFTPVGSYQPFGDPFDCVGFFTIAIWMTIFFCVILIAILGFGINAILSINTMDRFDDPKGKTITVTASD